MLLTAGELAALPSWSDVAPTFRLLGGGNFWCDAERVGRLVRLTRIAETEGGPKVREYYVNPRQMVTIVAPHAR